MHELLKEKKSIISWLEDHDVKNYQLVKDPQYGYKVNVDDLVYLSERNLSFIPVKFGRVNLNFNCSYNNLTTLYGCPDHAASFYCVANHLKSLQYASDVDDVFYCAQNQLTSLKGAPKRIKGNFVCSFNSLNSLEYAPLSVGEQFICHQNKLTSLKGVPRIIGSRLACGDNLLTSLEGAPQKVPFIDARSNPLKKLGYLPKNIEEINLRDTCFEHFNINELKTIFDKEVLEQNILATTNFPNPFKL